MEMFTATMLGVFPPTAVITEWLTWDTPVIHSQQQCLAPAGAELTAKLVN